MSKVFTPEALQALGAFLIILLTRLVPEFTPYWEVIVNSVVAILIALLTAQFASKATNAYFAVKSQELTFRYGGERAVLAKSEESNAQSDYYPDTRN